MNMTCQDVHELIQIAQNLYAIFSSFSPKLAGQILMQSLGQTVCGIHLTSMLNSAQLAVVLP